MPCNPGFPAPVFVRRSLTARRVTLTPVRMAPCRNGGLPDKDYAKPVHGVGFWTRAEVRTVLRSQQKSPSARQKTAGLW